MKYRFFLPVLGCWLALLGSCTPDRKFQPGTDYPEWAFDKPTYQRPAQEPMPYMKGTDGLPDVYHSNQQVVFIKRPDRPDLRNAPRPALFSTHDNGQSWKREGHFGLGEPYFALRVQQDGTYGICIIGAHRPDVAPPNLRIQQVQVVDSTAPRVEVSINPETKPYWVGQQIRLSWRITDVHATDTPGKLYSKVVDDDKPTPWELLKTGLASSGTVKITIEQIPQQAQGVIYRVEAIDEMGKIGAGHSKMLEVLPPAPETPVKEPSSTTFVRPKNQEQPKASVEPIIISPSPKTSRPLSTGSKTPAVSAKPVIQPIAKNQKDAEMAELEDLLAGISSPVFKGKVHHMPETKAAEPGPMIVMTSKPLPEAEPVEPSVEIVKIERVQKEAAQVVVDEGGTESAELLVPPLLEEPAAGQAEPIVTVRPPAEAKPVAPKPEPIVKVVPAVEPTPIVTAKPAPPTKAVGPSHGKYRMAKPWERLSKRNSSKYAPTLSNY